MSRARRISDGKLQAAAEAVGGLVDVSAPGASLLPQVVDLRRVSATVATAVIEQAVRENLAGVDVHDAGRQVRDAMWRPESRPVRGV